MVWNEWKGHISLGEGRDWPSLMGIISAHWLRWAETLGDPSRHIAPANSHWDRTGTLPALCHNTNRRTIFQKQLLSEQSSCCSPDQARLTRTAHCPHVCVCVCAHSSASGCSWQGLLLSFPFRNVNRSEIWLAQGENKGPGSQGYRRRLGDTWNTSALSGQNEKPCRRIQAP